MKRTTEPCVLALDLGGTKLASGLFRGKKLLHHDVTPLAGRTGNAVGELITQQIQEHLAHAKSLKLTIASIGICVPGIAHQKTGRVWAPNIPGWKDFPLRKTISAVVGPRVRVSIDSDRACYILGEQWQGSARGCQNAIFLAVGTGIGAGILVDGQVGRGAHDIGGAIGWLALDRPYRPAYKACGCFEHHASGEGLAKLAREILTTEKSYSGILRQKKDFTAHDLFDAYKSKDIIAVKTFQVAIEFWGMAVANLVSIFNPEKIIFGGGVFGPGTQFLDSIFSEAKKWAQPIAIKQVKIQASKLGSAAGLYGAGFLANSQITSCQ